LVKSSQKVQSIPKELHHSVQCVRTSLYDLNRELELYVNSKEEIQNRDEDLYDASGDDEGILAVRTCKSPSKLPCIGTFSNVHVVDIANPKTPQNLYYTFVNNSEYDTTDSATSSSEGFLPPKQSTSTKYLALTPLSDQDTKVENKSVIPVKESSTVRSRSSSPQATKVSGQQQKPLKEFSVKVIKLPPSVITSSRNANVINSAHLSSDGMDNVCTADDLMPSEDMECTGIDQANTVHTEQNTDVYAPKTEKDLLFEEGAVSCKETDNNASESVQIAKDDNSIFDDHLQDVAEVAVYGTSEENQTSNAILQKDCSNKSTSVPDSDFKDNLDELACKESSSKCQKNHSKRHGSKIKSSKYVVSSHSETECGENIEPENPMLTSSTKSTVKNNDKKIKSEKVVVLSCSENETNAVHPEKSLIKKSNKRQKSGYQSFTGRKGKSNMCITSSGSEHDEVSKKLEPSVGINFEKGSSLQNTNDSIVLSCYKHEETPHSRKKSHTAQRNKISTCATNTSFATSKQIAPSSPEQSFTQNCSPSQKQTNALVSHENKATDKLISVKRKLFMHESSEKLATEDNDLKGFTAKYKLRSKGNLFK